MVNIRLTCRLSRDIDENFEKFHIDINTDEDTISLEDKIYDKVKKKNDKIFSDIKAGHLELWKVQIGDDEFPKFVIKDNDTKCKELRGKIVKYWEEQPDTDFTHVIVDSKYLTMLKTFCPQLNLNQEQSVRPDSGEANQETNQTPNEETPEISNGKLSPEDMLHELISVNIIMLHDELWIEKDFEKKKVENGKQLRVKVSIGCKVTSIDKAAGQLSVSLLENEDKQMENISDLRKLEKWLLDEFKLPLEYRPIDFRNYASHISVKRDEWLGTIKHLRDTYFKNQEEKKLKKSESKSN